VPLPTTSPKSYKTLIMTNKNLHKRLTEQLSKLNLSDKEMERFSPFINLVDKTYKSSDKNLAQLENVLEISSQELHKANERLKDDNSKQALEIQIAKQSLDKVVDNVTDIIIEMDKSGNFVYLNKAWERFAEEPAEKGIGRNYMSYAGEIRSFDLKLNEKILNREFDNFKTVFSRLNKAGELKWWELSTKMIKNNENQIEGAIASIVDVTSLKETEAKLRKASDSKSKFLSTMSHEIRTPLNAVIGLSNILLMEDPKPDQVKNLQTLSYSSKHLLHLINDILDYNKLESGNLKLDNSPFNIRKEISNIVNALSHSAKKKNLILHCNIGEDVPMGLKGDIHRLSQVLTNLTNNAVKFTEEGHVTLCTTCAKKDDKTATLHFEVKDTGIGIAESKLKYIFERFTQAESDTTKKYGGTGLGLAISKKIVNLHDSEIHVTSEEGVGTRFYFDLEFEIDQDVKTIEDLGKKKIDLSLAGTHILLVDDNEINLMVAKQFLKKWQVTCDIAKNGEEAIEQMDKNDYELVLMDLQMPIKDGYTASREIRDGNGRNKETPIIALSASVSTDVTEKVINAGMNDYLCKPFDPEILFQKINYYAKKPAVKRDLVKV